MIVLRISSQPLTGSALVTLRLPLEGQVVHQKLSHTVVHALHSVTVSVFLDIGLTCNDHRLGRLALMVGQCTSVSCLRYIIVCLKWSLPQHIFK